MDGAHTHGHHAGGPGTAVLALTAVALAASVLTRVLTFVLIATAVAGGLMVIGLIGYVVFACRRYQQRTVLLNAETYSWPVCPPARPRPANADPVTLRQAITELHAQLLAAHGGLPAAEGSWHQHLHLHGLTPDQAAAIVTALQAHQHTNPWQDGGGQ
jgi:hypothetical protein